MCVLVNLVSVKRYAFANPTPPTPEGSSLEASANVLVLINAISLIKASESLYQ